MAGTISGRVSAAGEPGELQLAESRARSVATGRSGMSTRAKKVVRKVTVKGELPRHREIYEQLLGEIRSGVYKPGDRLPSEAVLCQRFDASRITVAKAIHTLERERLVTRRAGSGTYVEKPSHSGARQFGLLIPELGSTDIFEPICQGIMRSPAARSHSLNWGHSAGGDGMTAEAAEELVRQYIAHGVSGVFFAPMEFKADTYETNRRIAEQLNRAGLAVVLLDRDFTPYPERSHFDLVGIDNHQAGYVVTRHLIECGARRIVFAMRPHSASTVEARLAGYREALIRLADGQQGNVLRCDFEDAAAVVKVLRRERADAIVCANDVTAAKLMQSLVTQGVRIPDDIRIAGFDDVPYARFLPVPLTTYRQDCSAIGAAAMTAMLERVRHPELAIRDIRITGELVVRASSGAPTAEQPAETA